jgi:hypothetical protein
MNPDVMAALVTAAIEMANAPVLARIARLEARDAAQARELAELRSAHALATAESTTTTPPPQGHQYRLAFGPALAEKGAA